MRDTDGDEQVADRRSPLIGLPPRAIFVLEYVVINVCGTFEMAAKNKIWARSVTDTRKVLAAREGVSDAGGPVSTLR